MDLKSVCRQAYVLANTPNSVFPSVFTAILLHSFTPVLKNVDVLSSDRRKSEAFKKLKN